MSIFSCSARDWALGSIFTLNPRMIASEAEASMQSDSLIAPTDECRDWETCMTMNDTWGYKSYDDHWKPVETLIRNLVDIASKGGNYLLNVGPTAEGLIPGPSVERLQTVGAWMKVNGEAREPSTTAARARTAPSSPPTAPPCPRI